MLGNFGLRNIRLIPDIEVYKQLKVKKEQPAYLFNLSIDKARVHNINIYDLYYLNELNILENGIENKVEFVLIKKKT